MPAIPIPRFHSLAFEEWYGLRMTPNQLRLLQEALELATNARLKWLEANVSNVPTMMDVGPHLSKVEANLKLLLRTATKPDRSA